MILIFHCYRTADISTAMRVVPWTVETWFGKSIGGRWHGRKSYIMCNVLCCIVWCAPRAIFDILDHSIANDQIYSYCYLYILNNDDSKSIRILATTHKTQHHQSKFCCWILPFTAHWHHCIDTVSSSVTAVATTIAYYPNIHYYYCCTAKLDYITSFVVVAIQWETINLPQVRERASTDQITKEQHRALRNHQEEEEKSQQRLVSMDQYCRL
jgi:hypothetical protein